MNLTFKPIHQNQITQITKLLALLNPTISLGVLEERVREMIAYESYECVGAFDGDNLIGISGLWYSTKHYQGRSVEPNHFIVQEKYRGKGVRQAFFKWIYEYTKSKGCEVMEVNNDAENKEVHKFSYNEDFETVTKNLSLVL